MPLAGQDNEATRMLDEMRGAPSTPTPSYARPDQLVDSGRPPTFSGNIFSSSRPPPPGMAPDMSRLAPPPEVIDPFAEAERNYYAALNRPDMHGNPDMDYQNDFLATMYRLDPARARDVAVKGRAIATGEMPNPATAGTGSPFAQAIGAAGPLVGPQSIPFAQHSQAPIFQRYLDTINPQKATPLPPPVVAATQPEDEEHENAMRSGTRSAMYDAARQHASRSTREAMRDGLDRDEAPAKEKETNKPKKPKKKSTGRFTAS